MNTKNENFRYVLSRRVRYRQSLLQNLVISGRMIIITTADFNDRNSVVCPLCVRNGNVLPLNLNRKHRYVVCLCNRNTVCSLWCRKWKVLYFSDNLFRNYHHQKTCDNLLVLLNVILCIERFLAVRESTFEVMHFVWRELYVRFLVW